MAEKPDHTLVFTITNKSVKRLQKIQEWIANSLEDWRDADQIPLRGTDWEHKIDGKES